MLRRCRLIHPALAADYDGTQPFICTPTNIVADTGGALPVSDRLQAGYDLFLSSDHPLERRHASPRLLYHAAQRPSSGTQRARKLTAAQAAQPASATIGNAALNVRRIAQRTRAQPRWPSGQLPPYGDRHTVRDERGNFRPALAARSGANASQQETSSRERLP